MDPKAHLSGIFLKLVPLLACLCLLLLYAPTVSAQGGLELTVTKDSTAAGSYSDPITYTIGVTATEIITATITETITLTDTLPGGAEYTITSSIWGCDIDHPGNPGNLVTVSVPLGVTRTLVCQTDMTDGDSAPLMITGTVNTGDSAVVTNTVTVSGSEGSESDSASLTLNQPPIPTLNEWGMLILLAGLAACTVVYLRKRRAV
ncbi:MAG: hypothetical protein K9M96_12610 [Deltaproteobacteria bacterium]|nr:hypothetical protein [Deltaproteobacteria bacterium]